MELMCSFVYLLHFSSFISIIFSPHRHQFHSRAAAGLGKRSSSAQMYEKPQAFRCADHDAISVWEKRLRPSQVSQTVENDNNSVWQHANKTVSGDSILFNTAQTEGSNASKPGQAISQERPNPI